MAGHYRTLVVATAWAAATFGAAAFAKDVGRAPVTPVNVLQTQRCLDAECTVGRAGATRNEYVTTVLDLLSKERAPVQASPARHPFRASPQALDYQRLTMLISTCAPSSPPSLVRSIVLTESSGNPLVIATNGPVRRVYSPANRDAAAARLSLLIQQRVDVDIGLMQLNSTTLARLHIAPTEALDPCRNVAIGAKLFDQAYAAAFARRAPTSPLWSASSIYNTGNPLRGLSNGYAGRVQARLRTFTPSAS